MALFSLPEAFEPAFSPDAYDEVLLFPAIPSSTWSDPFRILQIPSDPVSILGSSDLRQPFVLGFFCHNQDPYEKA